MNESFENVPKVPVAKSPETRQESPEIMTYIEDQIRGEAKKLLVPEQGEILDPESIARIANFVVSQLETSGKTPDKELVHELMSSPEVADNIIKGTIVRLETKLEHRI
jgi:hypothetical protein